ncbi:uncharacterized protein [Arachis hypogaea]|uniref:uncharacterized protein n=1 Tax=Arachis hypogaea TaxID=3818 RepID=UPI003B219337
MASEANPKIDLQTLTNLLSQLNQIQSNSSRNQQNPALDPSSPYFLHLGDRSGTTLIPIALEHNNYQVWERAMWRALRGKNKIRFIDGSLQRPTQKDPLFDAWERCNTFVVSWINHSLSLNIAKSVIWINSAEELWRELKQRYCQGDMYKIAESEEEMYASKKGELSVTDYYTQLKIIWEELENFCPVPNCSRCIDRCTCKLSIMRNYREESQVVRFLRGLSDQFATVRSQLIMMNPMPKLESVFASILQQERQLNMLETLDSNALMVNARSSNANLRSEVNNGNMRGRGGRGRGGRGQKQCTYCGKLGHLIDVCYKKHGYPPNLKNNQSSFNNIVAEDDYEDSNMQVQSQREMDDRSEPHFTLEQREALLALLQNQESQPRHSINQISTTTLPSNKGISYIMSLSVFSPRSWVIDSGATNHVAYSHKSFHRIYKINPVIINMPDGTRTIATLAGNVFFLNNLQLFNVFYIPTFKFNLISVSKLTMDSECQLIFDENGCAIQEKKTLKTVGVAKQRSGLYAFENFQPVAATNYSNKLLHVFTHVTSNSACINTHTSKSSYPDHSALWHLRLGHLPNHRIKPDISYLRIFGCLVYASTLVNHRRKLDKRARKCVYLGIKEGVKGHLLYDLSSRDIFISRNTIFYEFVLPFTVQEAVQNEKVEIETHPDFCIHDLHTFDDPLCIEIQQSHTQPGSQQQTASRFPSLDQAPSASSHTNIPIPSHTPIMQPLRRSTRETRKPAYLADFQCMTTSSALLATPDFSTTHFSQCLHETFFEHQFDIIHDLKQNFFEHSTLLLFESAIPDSALPLIPLCPSSIEFANQVTFQPKHIEPKCYAEAVTDLKWQEAINVELNALKENKTWTLTHLPAGKRTVGYRWVFKLKLNADGTVERHKTRLVAQGFTQTAGVDYLETFSPVVKMTTLRILLAIAAVKGWFVHQLDVNTAFLHGDLVEEVYMKPPPGLFLSDPGLVCKLDRSLYGLKQASRWWNTKLTSTLLSIGYCQSRSDYSLFTKSTKSGFTVILVYVDDLIVSGDDMAEISFIKQHLHLLFKIKDIGELKFFLALEVIRSKRGIMVNQKKYCLDLLKDYNLLNAKLVATPMDYTIKLTKNSENPLQSNTEYRKLIGKLIYLTNTRTEIGYAVGRLSQYLDCPTNIHFEAALRVLKYLRGTPTKGLMFAADTDLTPTGFSDSDWRTCSDTRRSTSGYYFFIGTSIVS